MKSEFCMAADAVFRRVARMHRSRPPLAQPSKKAASLFAYLVLWLVPLSAQQATVDITPGHSTNSYSPLRALGAGVDRDPLDSTRILYDPAHVEQMLAAGWGSISYRLNTELSMQAWHWNPIGTWSDPAGQGYFVGSPNSSGPNQRSFGYNLPHRYIRPAAERAKITKRISWHIFRHTFSTLLAENDEDVKTVQSLMRHANSNITMNIYTHAVSSKKRRAQSKVVEMILPQEKTTPVAAGVA